ncbi:hypothetical protein K502DRAFT_349665 [Neoconidiobolus thromboides FSU 785]|nr:hypothetical protein K502DRAFT_349665 [Neoconidiobolus thromboides FSU 785]
MFYDLLKLTYILLILFYSITCDFINPTDLLGQPNSCVTAASHIYSLYPDLNNCSFNNGLYFATLSQVCNPSCLKAVTSASLYLVGACPALLDPDSSRNKSLLSGDGDIQFPLGDKMDVYKAWSNSTVNSISCAKLDANVNVRSVSINTSDITSSSDSNNNVSYCLDRFFQANQFIQSLKYQPASAAQNTNLIQSKICDPCTKLLYGTLKSSSSVPFLYYWTFSDTTNLFRSIRSYCSF